MAAGEAAPTKPRQEKQYDYLLKFLLVGDSDVGKQEILSGLEDGASESPFCGGIYTYTSYKTTTILLDGKRVKLQLWDTSGQGRFCTIIRSYSRGAQGILLHAPGVPKVLVGNRLHLAFKRQVGERDAEIYAAKNHMAFFEVSPLCDFNIRESFSELSRMALHRNGMERLWRSNKVLTLQEIACRTIVARTTVYEIDQLPLPKSIKSHLKSYAMTTTSQLRCNRSQNSSKSLGSHHRKLRFVGAGHNGLTTPGNSPGSITDSRSSCAGRNSCAIS
ncbi:Similar to Rab40c: Ras-related protein Rab-40C (Mus musculus) [Cotesia congregata]|uniref:Similar to Rab40c: Ras-related protein Rab-40C (Mus musculus) n=1 Tax=Cotesia congregata TaxID=51543 RepID=A0A8J2HKX7_COTCN|nr:Similar to Rab40c: Ras-related protein Rab-40C (Mus musculus) [Cotesia congregata]